MNIDTRVLLLIFKNMSYYFWMITWMKNVNSLQIPKVQPQVVALHMLDFLSVSSWHCL